MTINLTFNRILKSALICVFLFSLSTGQVFAKCGTKSTIEIAEMDWQSAGTLAHIVQIVLRDGYGCKTKLIPGSTVPTASSMLSKGRPHIAPELWTGSIAEIWKKATSKGKVYSANTIFGSGPAEGIHVPQYVLDQNPGLKSLSDLKDYAHLFEEVSSKGKGRLYTCPPGWACEIIMGNLFKALDISDSYELFSPGSGANLDASIARRVAQKKPVLTYYWAPTAIVGKMNLVKLAEPPFDEKKFKCLTDKNCENPQASAWIVGNVAVAAVKKIKKIKNVAKFLSKLQVPNNELNKTLAWMDESKASNEETAKYFLKTYGKIWSKWVGRTTAKKIKKAL